LLDKTIWILKILGGLSLLIIGLKIFSRSLEPLANLDIIQAIDNPYIMAPMAMGGTLLWQSSSITTVILIGMISGGLINLPTALGGVIGANVGTCGTALIASTGVGKVGFRVALFHLMFNLIDSLIWLPFVYLISRLIYKIVPS